MAVLRFRGGAATETFAAFFFSGSDHSQPDRFSSRDHPHRADSNDVQITILDLALYRGPRRISKGFPLSKPPS
jgi:hypothetical protein